MKILITATLSDLKDGMVKAFENFAIKAGFNVKDKSRFKCTSIEVSKEIDDYFWKYYTDDIKSRNPNIDDEEIKATIAMLMLQNGAKRDEKLDAWQVALDEDFVINED